MSSLNLADAFVTFLAVIGPQKVLLSFARLSRTLGPRTFHLVDLTTALAAACVGVLCGLTAPWVATFFHITTASLELAAGLVFFIYAIGLVLGFHFDFGEELESGAEATAAHPLGSGFREMLLPFVVSPLGVAAVLLTSLAARSWADRWTVVGAFVLVVLIDMVSGWIFAPLLGRANEIVLEVLSRLLGTLLAAVGVQLFLQGLVELKILSGLTGH